MRLLVLVVGVVVQLGVAEAQPTTSASSTETARSPWSAEVRLGGALVKNRGDVDFSNLHLAIELFGGYRVAPATTVGIAAVILPTGTGSNAKGFSASEQLASGFVQHHWGRLAAHVALGVEHERVTDSYVLMNATYPDTCVDDDYDRLGVVGMLGVGTEIWKGSGAEPFAIRVGVDASATRFAPGSRTTTWAEHCISAPAETTKGPANDSAYLVTVGVGVRWN